jgi:exodeoxyribonuclease III
MTLKAATFNANSIRSRQGIVLDWLKRENPDILGIQETKVQDKDFPAGPFEEAGYHIAYHGQKSYNGVAVLSRFPMEDVRVHLGEDGPDAEARFISARIGAVRLINVYVPQGYAVGTDRFENKLRWLKLLLEHIRSHYEPADPLLMTGDFNVAVEARDVHDPESLDGQVCFHPEERAIFREFLDWGLVDVLRRHEPGEGLYTFWDYRIPNGVKRNLGWRIDYILATPPLAETSIGARIDVAARLLAKPSDHTFLQAEFSYPE